MMDHDNTLPGNKPQTGEVARIDMMLRELKLPTIREHFRTFSERADHEGWPATRLLSALLEHELEERSRRRILRYITEARLLPGKTLDGFDFAAVPTISKARVMALAAGDTWLRRGACCLVFGPPGVGKSHLSSALGLALIDVTYRLNMYQ